MAACLRAFTISSAVSGPPWRLVAPPRLAEGSASKGGHAGGESQGVSSQGLYGVLAFCKGVVVWRLQRQGCTAAGKQHAYNRQRRSNKAAPCPPFAPKPLIVCLCSPPEERFGWWSRSRQQLCHFALAATCCQAGAPRMNRVTCADCCRPHRRGCRCPRCPAAARRSYPAVIERATESSHTRPVRALASCCCQGCYRRCDAAGLEKMKGQWQRRQRLRGRKVCRGEGEHCKRGPCGCDAAVLQNTEGQHRQVLQEAAECCWQQPGWLHAPAPHSPCHTRSLQAAVGHASPPPNPHLQGQGQQCYLAISLRGAMAQRGGRKEDRGEGGRQPAWAAASTAPSIIAPPPPPKHVLGAAS